MTLFHIVIQKFLFLSGMSRLLVVQAAHQCVRLSPGHDQGEGNQKHPHRDHELVCKLER